MITPCNCRQFYHESRELIKESLHGTDDDVVLFAGNGCTGAIALFAKILGLSKQTVAGSTAPPTAGTSTAASGARASGTTTSQSTSYTSRANGKGGGDGGDGNGFACAFPQCGRVYTDAAGLTLHARTHADGDRTAVASAAAGAPLPPPPSASTPLAAAAGATVVVFVGPMEHHSNLLVWREAAECEVVQIKPTKQGRVDMADLEAKLVHWKVR